MEISLLNLLILWLLFIVYMYIRVERVYRFRRKLIDIVFSFYDYRWRQSVLDSVTFDKMMFQFWRPLRVEEWWSDCSFLKPDDSE